MDIAVNGVLTLDAQGDQNAVWIFQLGSALTANVGSKVVLINGAKAANVFWAIGSSSTINANVDFKGTVMAQASNSVGTGSTVEGRLVCTTGEITLLSKSSPCPPSEGSPEVERARRDVSTGRVIHEARQLVCLAGPRAARSAPSSPKENAMDCDSYIATMETQLGAWKSTLKQDRASASDEVAALIALFRELRTTGRERAAPSRRPRKRRARVQPYGRTIRN